MSSAPSNLQELQAVVDQLRSRKSIPFKSRFHPLFVRFCTNEALLMRAYEGLGAELDTTQTQIYQTKLSVFWQKMKDIGYRFRQEMRKRFPGGHNRQRWVPRER
jgi:hypothetical protein